MWHSLDEWKGLKEGYEKTLFAEIQVDDISKEADKYQKIANRIIKILPPNPIQDELKDLVETFKGAMPIVKALRNPVLNEEHMDAINNLVENGKLDINQEGFTLQSLIDLNVVQYQEEIVAISVRATGENKLKIALADLQEQWVNFNLVHDSYKNKEGVYVLGAKEDLQNFLDESLAQINMIRGNQYKAVIEKEAE